MLSRNYMKHVQYNLNEYFRVGCVLPHAGNFKQYRLSPEGQNYIQLNIAYKVMKVKIDYTVRKRETKLCTCFKCSPSDF